MKKFLTFTLLFAAHVNVSAYTKQDLQSLEATSAAIKSATSIVNALAPEMPSECQFIGAIAGEINNLTSYALYEQSDLMAITRVIDRITAKESWQYAPQADVDFMALFAKELGIELSHGACLEIVNLIQQIILKKLIPDNRIARRIAATFTSSCTKSIIDTTFAYFSLEPADTDDAQTHQREQLLKFFITRALQTFYTQAAYHTAGELIAQQVSTTNA